MFTFKNIKDINDLKNFIGKHVGIVAMVCGGFQFSKEEEIAFFSEAEKMGGETFVKFLRECAGKDLRYIERAFQLAATNRRVMESEVFGYDEYQVFDLKKIVHRNQMHLLPDGQVCFKSPYYYWSDGRYYTFPEAKDI